MAETADVVIIGGGVMGESIALNLGSRGIRDAMIVEKTSLPWVPLAKARRASVSSTPPKVRRGWSVEHIAVFVTERLLDLGAEKLGLDPAEIRLRNMIRKEDHPYTTIIGTNIESGSPGIPDDGA